MTPSPPADAGARERIRRDLDATLFVEAGAGTGKTTVLVARILRLIATGRAQLREIAAITFTEAAAAELRDRIQSALERAARDPKLSVEESARCREALAQLDEAAISTLHGFAQRLLAEHSLDAGLPPGFQIMDATAAQLALSERWDVFVEALLADPDAEEALLCAFGLGIPLESLRLIAEQLNDHWDRLPPAAPAPASPLSTALIAELSAGIAQTCGALTECQDPADGLYLHLLELSDLHRRLERASHPANALRLLRSRSLRCSRGRQENWNGRAPQLKEQLSQLEERRQELLARIGAQVLQALLPRLTGFVLDAASARARDGLVEFHDLLVHARDLLRDRPAARAAVRRRLSHLLVDEFQDTDPLQFEIAMALASDSAADDGGGGGEQASAVEPGRLFFVGDAKQSIYRFRRADIALYQQAQRRFGAGGVELTQNFRTVPSITDWVNRVFAELMALGADDGQAEYRPLRPHRSPAGPAPAVHVLGGPAAERVDPIREREARDVAALLRRVRDEQWQVSDSGGGWRAARYHDIAVLLPTRAALGHLEQALEDAEVPYRVEASSLVYASQEVRELLAILRAVDDPTDEVALLAALRSPAFACADDELYEHWLAGGRWDCRAPSPLGAQHAVGAALARLAALHERRWWETPGGMIEAVVRECRLMELAFAHRRPRDIWRRLRFVAEQARAFGEAGAGLRSFLAWIQQQLEDGARVTEQVLPDVDDDAVRIMTVHAAKGLEFPIAVLAGLNAARRGPGGVQVAWNEADELQARVRKGLETPGFSAVADREQLQDSYEAVRLLYVAATRARDHLIVSVHCPDGTATDASTLHELCERWPQLWAPAAPAPAAALPPVGEPATPPGGTSQDREGRGSAAPPAADTPEDLAAWLAERAERIAAAARPSAIAATGLSDWLESGEDRAEDAGAGADQELAASGRGSVGTSIGRAVHAVLQTIDLATGDGLAEAARAQAAAEGVPARAAEIERLAARALDSPAVREAVASGRFWREVYTAAPAGDLLVEGFVDLLYETPQGLAVVDYKTDRVDGGDDIQRLLLRYRVQGAAYALALEAAVGQPVARCEFVFLGAEPAVQREIDDLPGTVAALRRSLTGPRAAPRPPHA